MTALYDNLNERTRKNQREECFTKLKQIVSAVLAAGILASALSPFGAFAASYDSRDVNRDGKVNATDTLYLSKALLGIVYESNLNILDVDNNHIISQADLNCITTSVMTGATYSNRVEGSTKSFGVYTSTATSTGGASVSEKYVDKNTDPWQMYTDVGKIVKSSTNSEIRYTANATGGQSGSPVYVKETYYINGVPETLYTVIGIHSGHHPDRTYSCGAVLSPIKVKFFKNNSHIIY